VYESFFRFARPPFRLVADPSMLFASRSAREALSGLEYVVRTGKGLAVMTGEVGTGKTTLVNRFLDRAGPELRTAYIFNPSLSGLQLLRTLAEELGVSGSHDTKVELTRAIYAALLQNRSAGRRTVVFVDEAQNLTPEALEELRLVSNLETWREKLVHIVLVGQPELLAKLESFQLRQLRQRVELYLQIEPMSATETQQYIDHRLRIAQPQREVHFTAGSCQLIHRLSRGIPRDINKICDAALLVAYVEETGTMTTKHVREGVRTIDAGAVGLRLRHGLGGAWARIGAVAAALAALAALAAVTDSVGPTHPRPAGAGRTGALTPAAAAAVTASAGPGAADAMLVHLASFRERAEAERFARRIGVPAGRVLYLQSVTTGTGMWHRVLLGDFADYGAAKAYAAQEEASGGYAYAQAVHVPRAGLEVWGTE
jgi:general secretion pathway protein A